jgi:hypothetical protein
MLKPGKWLGGHGWGPDWHHEFRGSCMILSRHSDRENRHPCPLCGLTALVRRDELCISGLYNATHPIITWLIHICL